MQEKVEQINTLEICKNTQNEKTITFWTFL